MGIAVGMMVVGMVATAQGEEDCPGTPWRNSVGKSCIDVGLHSRHGTCLPGDRYEMLCDDKKNMIKACQGPRRCQEEDVHRYRDDSYRRQEPCYWDFIKNQPCPRGFINLDCKAGCDSRESR